MNELEAAERRSNVRLHRVLAIEVEHEGTFRRLFAVDVSASGFRVAAEFPLRRGTSVGIKLHLRGGPSVEGAARVVWTQALELGLHQSGCEFEQLASPEDFKSLLAYIERERLTGEAAPPQELELEAQVALRDLTIREVDRLSVLARICELMNSSYQFHEVWERVLRVAVEATGAERGLLLLDRGGTEMEVPVAHGVSPDSPAGLNYSRSVVEQVMRSGQPLLSLDALRDERLARSTSLKVLGTRSILCVPMSSRERSCGLIYLDNSVRAGVFTEVDLQLASVIAGLAAAAMERAEYFSQLLQNEKMAAMGTMMAGIVHELNNPLTSILCISELLKEQSSGDLVESLVQEAVRCRKLVQDLLQVARKEHAEMAPVRLDELVRSTLPMVQKQFARQNLELLVETSEALPPVRGNPDHLRQVVLNLLSNALFAVREQEQGRVEVRVIERGGRVLLVVGDNGPGILPENLGRIFDPFFTTKGAGQGTGLGLSILQKIVTDHRGTVQASNRASGGALFTVELPALPVG